MAFLNTRSLATRWQCSTRKIEQLRQSGGGPAYVKIGQQVLYDEDVIKVFEAENTFGSTAERDEANASQTASEPASLSHQTIFEEKE